MRDIGLTYDSETMEFDINFSKNDLVMDSTLATAVITSLYTDARATADMSLPDESSKDLRGWWGSSTSKRENDNVGSLLWLLNRTKTTEANIKAVKDYINAALQWMLDEGIVMKIDIITERKKSASVGDRLYVQIRLYKRDGKMEAMNFDEAWRI